MKVLANRLNEIILDESKNLNYEVQDVAPATFQDLVKYGLKVWSGASDGTIYGDFKINHAFRAWHDSLHISLNAPFTLEGEIYVAMEQARQVQSDELGLIILAEVKGQAEYFDKFGMFPANQSDFITAYLKAKGRL